MKKKLAIYIFSLITAFSFIMHQSADVYARIYTNVAYAITVPDTFKYDGETVENYASITKDNINIGISVSDNLTEDDVTTYTEAKIQEIKDDTLAKLTTQTGEGIRAIKHEITTFSENEYAALHIVYEGSIENDPDVYMEEYIITMSNYKYIIVFSTDTAADMENDDIKSIIESFGANDTPIIHADPADERFTLIMLIASLSIVILTGIIVIVKIFRNYAKRKY
ncbi:MAG: hypothetical protein E7267_02395 [Lachnospiraceae bacterium]|nr:hypothetical protein [Lachnospiraceae bacterium]